MPIFRRWALPAFLTLLLAVVITACTEEESVSTGATATATATVVPTTTATSTTTAAFPVTITDSNRRQVTIPAPPQRIVALAPSHVEILFALRAGDKVVAADQNTDFPPEASKIKKLSGFPAPNLEEVAALNPDLVVVIFDKSVPEMEKLGLKVLVLSAPDTVDGVYDQIRTWGRITGRSENAEKLVADMRGRVDAINKKLADVSQGPRVFLELDPALFTVGTGSFTGDMLKLVKARNVTESSEGPFPQLSQEVLISRNPDIILLADSGKYGEETPDKVKARPGWDSISAVKNNRVYMIDTDLVSRPGPRIVEGLEMLARLLYPEKFS